MGKPVGMSPADMTGYGGEQTVDPSAAPVLIADDNPRNLFSLSEALADLGVEIVCAESGDDVLREVLSRDFAVILLDARMPGMDGYETATLLRQRVKSQHIPIIFLTAVDKDDRHIFRGYSAGAVDYVFKPVDPFILRAKISVFLNLHRQAAEIRRQAEESRRLLEENQRTRKANDEYVERLQHLSRQLLTLQDRERRSLARELHDEVGQCLTALKLNLQALMPQLDAARAKYSLAMESVEIVNNLVSQVRSMSLEMHPSMLEDFGLETTLKWYVERLSERSELRISTHFALGDIALPPDTCTALYRIAQSALINVARHAEATCAHLELAVADSGELRLVVTDDGKGFDQETAASLMQAGKSFGLLSMRERAFLIGADLTISSETAGGTTVRLLMPLPKRRARPKQDAAPLVQQPLR